MNSGVRIIKRGRADGPQGLPPGRGEKTDRQREREIVGAVKGWIIEWEKAKGGDELLALALIKWRSAKCSISLLPNSDSRRSTMMKFGRRHAPEIDSATPEPAAGD